MMRSIPIALATFLAFGSASWSMAQTGAVQDAINRDLMNRATLRKANGGRDYHPKPPANLVLYGRWLPMEETRSKTFSHCAFTEMVYTPTSWTTTTPPIGPYPAERSTDQVDYNTRDAARIWVIARAVGAEGRWVQVIDRNHIKPEAADDCTYRRAG